MSDNNLRVLRQPPSSNIVFELFNFTLNKNDGLRDSIKTTNFFYCT